VTNRLATGWRQMAIIDLTAAGLLAGHTARGNAGDI
jgi:hypothetical protein